MTITHNHPILKPRRIELRKNQTPQEILLWARLRGNQLRFWNNEVNTNMNGVLQKIVSRLSSPSH